jgi:DNA-binding IclR family transcriptional regulator
VIYLARYEAGRPLRLTGQIGDRFPATVTATGKALLSTLSDGVVKDRYREQVLPRYTERSIQTLPQLLEDLALCRERGYAMDDEETNFGFVCFAIPVIDTPGSPARFSVSTTMSKQRADEVSPGVVVAEYWCRSPTCSVIPWWGRASSDADPSARPFDLEGSGLSVSSPRTCIPGGAGPV